MQSDKVFSGIQPTGSIHIGNYLGAIKNWVNLSKEYECIYGVVDYHAITVKYDIRTLQGRIQDVILDLLACGLDGEKARLFIQSDVKEHTELAWILSSVSSMGWLERMTQFKDKSRQNKENINAGLFTYPILQTADIVLYKAKYVPVGKDQAQHIELAREIVRTFNREYGEVLVEPKELLTESAKVLGLCGANKMSKSQNNYIGINESKEVVRKKLMRAKTDENRKKRSDAGNPLVCNIYSYHKLFSTKELQDKVWGGCIGAEIGCVECKAELLESLYKELEPIQARRKELSLNVSEVMDMIRENGRECREEAKATMNEVKDAMGLR